MIRSYEFIRGSWKERIRPRGKIIAQKSRIKSFPSFSPLKGVLNHMIPTCSFGWVNSWSRVKNLQAYRGTHKGLQQRRNFISLLTGSFCGKIGEYMPLYLQILKKKLAKIIMPSNKAKMFQNFNLSRHRKKIFTSY